ncbi:hypothetical protein vBOeSunk162_27 [Oenococcus phage vB_OeS_unk162]|nr:hypothetical protein vBOeSunk162_27 [Oenococcus phage vB_OeS_unk162]
MTEIAKIEPIVKYQPASIEITNKEILEGFIEAKIDSALKTKISPENLQEAKKQRASLNKLATSLNNSKRAIKKRVQEPLKDIDDILDELKQKVDTASISFDTVIKNIENDEKVHREQKLIDFIDQTAQSFPDVNVLGMAIPDNWLNKSMWTNKDEPTSKLNDEIRSTLTAFQTRANEKKSTSKVVQSYCDAVHVDSEPYLRYIEQDLNAPEIISMIDDDRKRQQEKNSRDYQVDTDTGEVIQDKKTEFTYVLELTKLKENKLNIFLKNNNIEIKKVEKND